MIQFFHLLGLALLFRPKPPSTLQPVGLILFIAQPPARSDAVGEVQVQTYVSDISGSLSVPAGPSCLNVFALRPRSSHLAPQPEDIVEFAFRSGTLCHRHC